MRSLLAQAKAKDPTAEIKRLEAATYEPHQLDTLVSPSLFGEPRLVYVPALEQMTDALLSDLIAYVGAADPEVSVILRHNGGQRGKRLLDAIKASPYPTVQCDAIKNAKDKSSLVVADVRRAGRSIAPEAVGALVDALGSDLRELCSAVDQLLADTQGTISVDHVRTYFTGVAEVSGFDIADLACNGETQRAIASTRRALQLGIDPIVLAAALGGNIAAIARLYSARSVGEAKDRAGVVKMPPWKIESTYKKARRWDGDNISKAVIIIAELDAATKGQGGDPGYAIENAVRQIAELAP